MADSLRSLLEGMGETAEEVAAFLEGQGVKGHRGSAFGCPIANYLRQATGAFRAGVDQVSVSWSD